MTNYPLSDSYIVPIEIPEEIYKIADMIHSSDTEINTLGCILFAEVIKRWPDGIANTYVTKARFRVFIKRVEAARMNRKLPRDRKLTELLYKYCK